MATQSISISLVTFPSGEGFGLEKGENKENGFLNSLFGGDKNFKNVVLSQFSCFIVFLNQSTIMFQILTFMDNLINNL